MNYHFRRNARFGTTTIKCEDKYTASIFLAAPKMYEALKKVFTEVTNGNYGELSPQVRAMVANAIKLAEGKE